MKFVLKYENYQKYLKRAVENFVVVVENSKEVVENLKMATVMMVEINY